MANEDNIILVFGLHEKWLNLNWKQHSKELIAVLELSRENEKFSENLS